MINIAKLIYQFSVGKAEEQFSLDDRLDVLQMSVRIAKKVAAQFSVVMIDLDDLLEDEKFFQTTYRYLGEVYDEMHGHTKATNAPKVIPFILEVLRAIVAEIESDSE